MKKTLAVILLCLLLVTLCACGDKNPSSHNVFGHEQFVSGQYSVSYTAYSVEEMTAYLQSLKTANGTTPNLENGIKIYLSDDVTVSPTTVKNFELYLQKVGDVLIAQGSYLMVVGEAQAETKIYHDGTYFGMQTEENGQTYKVKEQLPIKNIGNLVGITDFIDIIIESLEINQIDKVFEKELPPSGMGVGKFEKVKGFVVDEYVRLDVNYDSFLAFDMSNNLIAYYIGGVKTNNDSTVNIGVQCAEKTVTMPEDFASWEVR